MHNKAARSSDDGFLFRVDRLARGHIASSEAFIIVSVEIAGFPSSPCKLRQSWPRQRGGHSDVFFDKIVLISKNVSTSEQ